MLNFTFNSKKMKSVIVAFCVMLALSATAEGLKCLECGTPDWGVSAGHQTECKADVDPAEVNHVDDGGACVVVTTIEEEGDGEVVFRGYMKKAMLEGVGLGDGECGNYYTETWAATQEPLQDLKMARICACKDDSCNGDTSKFSEVKKRCYECLPSSAITTVAPGTEDPATGGTEEEQSTTEFGSAGTDAGNPTSQEPASPTTQEPASPTTQEPASPTTKPTKEPASPTTQEPASPTTQEPASPTTQEPASPTTQEPASPTTQEPASPTTQEPASPTTQEPASPTTQEPASPTAESPAPKAIVLNVLNSIQNRPFVARQQPVRFPHLISRSKRSYPVQGPGKILLRAVVKEECSKLADGKYGDDTMARTDDSRCYVVLNKDNDVIERGQTPRKFDMKGCKKRSDVTDVNLQNHIPDGGRACFCEGDLCNKNSATSVFASSTMAIAFLVAAFHHLTSRVHA